MTSPCRHHAFVTIRAVATGPGNLACGRLFYAVGAQMPTDQEVKWCTLCGSLFDEAKWRAPIDAAHAASTIPSPPPTHPELPAAESHPCPLCNGTGHLTDSKKFSVQVCHGCHGVGGI